MEFLLEKKDITAIVLFIIKMFLLIFRKKRDVTPQQTQQKKECFILKQQFHLLQQLYDPYLVE
jgi:hypothetical protein